MKAYLRQLADEFGESTNSVRIELNRLTEAGLLESYAEGNTIMYQAKTSYPLFPELKKIVSKITGIDQIIEEVIQRLGSLHTAYLIGDYAKGKDSGVIDVILVGKVDKVYLNELIVSPRSELSTGWNSPVVDLIQVSSVLPENFD
jgi:DNA-binding transcriptional ArsR family regulator